MLSPEENERLTCTGRGTPMGELLRRFWMPALLSEELPEADCTPVRVRIMSEDLVAFRDTTGRVGLLDAYCAHRRANLFWGRNEEAGLRCVYHGWKYDVTGQCVDMPNEPAESRFKDKIALTAYPARDWGGVIWTYLGPPELTPPELPQFEWARVSAEHRDISKRFQETNWAQAVEGGIDSSHVSFLHSQVQRDDSLVPGVLEGDQMELLAKDTSPRFTVKPTDYGFVIGARRSADDEQYYWRISQFLLPAFTMIPPALDPTSNRSGHAWVPIDDEHTWTFSVTWNPFHPLGQQVREDRRSGNGLHAQVDPGYRPVRNKDNDYLIDREMQRHKTFTGIKGISEQDMAMQESMGPLVDRSKEHLGTTDTAVIAFRRRLLSLARDLEDGQDPYAAQHGETYRVRSASVLLAPSEEFDEGAKDQLLSQA